MNWIDRQTDRQRDIHSKYYRKTHNLYTSPFKLIMIEILVMSIHLLFLKTRKKSSSGFQMNYYCGYTKYERTLKGSCQSSGESSVVVTELPIEYSSRQYCSNQWWLSFLAYCHVYLPLSLYWSEWRADCSNADFLQISCEQTARENREPLGKFQLKIGRNLSMYNGVSIIRDSIFHEIGLSTVDPCRPNNQSHYAFDFNTVWIYVAQSPRIIETPLYLDTFLRRYPKLFV
jgi:hypothetical protein